MSDLTLVVDENIQGGVRLVIFRAVSYCLYAGLQIAYVQDGVRLLIFSVVSAAYI